MLETALLYDATGAPIQQDRRTHSDDWDEVQEFCRTVYMPYRVTPGGKLLKPDATMYAAQVGRITMTRFAYGVPIRLDDFDPDAGNILVLNTIKGGLRHLCDQTGPAETGAGDSFVVDCSRTDYWLEGDADHMQLNLTIPHDVMEETAERWFGFIPDNALWTRRLAFGGMQSSWIALLEYATRSIQMASDAVASGRMGQHLEEMLCLDLLRFWTAGAGINLDTGARNAAPRYVREAEVLMAELACEAPTIGQIAKMVGISARTLSSGFRRFRGTTPHAFLAARRLDGLRAALMAAGPQDTVSSIAADWGYVNFGTMAVNYRKRFGESPSQSLRRG